MDGAVVEDVTCTNITMREVNGAPIFIRLGARMRGPEDVSPGKIRRIILSNITCLNARGSEPISSILSGVPGHPIEYVKISDIIIAHIGGGTKEDAQRRPPEKEKDYPEPNMFGITPSHGFFIRHVNFLEMNGVEISHYNLDVRPSFVLEDVERADFGRIKAGTMVGAPTFALSNVKYFTVYRSKPVPDTELDSAEKTEL